MNDKIIAYAFPGQSEAVRIGLGRTVWIMEEGETFPRSISKTWRDKLPEGATEMSPEEFIKKFPPAEGSVVYRENARRAEKQP
jgi:hypothetical protein